MAGPDLPKKGRKERNRVLCRLRKTPFSFDAQLGLEINRKMRCTTFALHYCNNCSHRPKVVLKTAKDTYQWL